MTKGEVMNRKRMLALQLKLAELDKQKAELCDEMAQLADGLCPWEWAEKHEMKDRLCNPSCRRLFGEPCRLGGAYHARSQCWHVSVFILPENLR